MKFHLSNLFNGRKALAEQEETSGEMNILKAGLLEKPESAIAQARLAAKLMFDETKDASILAAGLLKDYEENAYMQIKKSEEKVDLYEDQICNYLLEISKRKLTTAESQRVSVLLHTVNDLETISDCTCSIGLAYRNMYEKNTEFSQEAAQQLELAQQAVREMLEKTRAMFDDIRQIQEVYAYHQVVSELLDRFREKHIERLKSSRCMVESGLVLTDLINYYERIAVRCQRIAGYLMQEGNEALKIHGHEYWFPAKDYRELYEGCRERYLAEDEIIWGCRTKKLVRCPFFYVNVVYNLKKINPRLREPWDLW